MPIRCYGMHQREDQTPTRLHVCPAKDGKTCGEPIALPKAYQPGDPQITLNCPNPKCLRPHKVTIFTTHNPENPDLHGKVQITAAAEFPS